ncbi:prokaryotic phospholipase A2 domain-containing protein [Hirsutella rhossiliensis]|uniref:Prokaryotic phospholipase a2 domain-containing protein n=1 Tax=Hirsutella rhossiliensis TaxID=111463 RepID=A0A9P8SP29_9HYPO|nr:prokaryotic phospholipase a2 domain-containing protein [Hirsutella rhossiliensis]KAH0968495.1 prokaryotic phospholipase a2 domain-containing protein [Hirsutella rhossiliensis]
MKLVAVILALVSAALAVPAAVVPPQAIRRQSLQAITDKLAFTLTLPSFTARRNRRDPPSLDWSSDGCTASPNNPFGFPFLPGCHRHDFGYRNFRKQRRFNQDNKDRIDIQFKTDLYFQCEQVSAKSSCERLADIYYLAVKTFGGSVESKRDAEYSQAYAEAVKAYDDAVEKAQEEGLLPVLNLT